MRPLLLALLFTAAAPSAFAAAPPADRTVTGIAVDAQGRPVAGAEVWLPPYYDTESAYAAYLEAGPAAVTGRDGHFKVSLPDFMPETWIDVCVPGSLTGQIDPRPSGGAAAAGPLRVVVRPGARIFGRAVDAAGNPLAGVSLGTVLAGDERSDLITHLSPCKGSGIDARTTTDREGRFTLEPLKPGWYTVKTDGGTDVSASVQLAPAQALELLLVIDHDVQISARISGRVTARDGSPVPRAWVSSGPAGTATITDAAGYYQLAGNPPGPIRMMAFESRHGTVYREAEVTEGDNDLDLELPDLVVLRGRVLGPDGGPAAGATVAIRSAHTATAEDGTLRLSFPGGDGDETLTVQAAGLAPAEAMVKDQSGAFDPLVVHLVRPGSISGHITGLPTPAGTRITAYPYLFSGHLGGTETVAGAAGLFRLPALAPGPWVVAAEHQKQRRQTQVTVTAGAESVLDLTFAPSAEDRP
jgi:hypothetical protein